MILVGAVLAAAWYWNRSPQPGRLTLRIHPFVGDEPLELDQVRYANPGGEGSFKVRDFQFFVSNIRLESKSGGFVEPESYHLARFDSDDGIYAIVIEALPREDYRRIELGIGVDPSANGTIASVGDLDPNGRMAWSWDVGYKFVLFEGALVVGETQYPLVYHVGFDENYREVSLDLDEFLFEGPEATVDLRADLLQLFDGVKTVDMASMSDVIFDRTDAKLLADNYAHMISICPSPCSR
ncbi:MAG TPA: MbnP family protein [Gammaproteobacteria bacterium]|nr:MbnP family protein [Gammaproteobacteria bacterium]